MNIFVTAKPRAKKSSLEQIDEVHFMIAVKEPPTDNKANLAIAKALSTYLHIPLSNINLLSGHSAKKKVFVI